MPTWDDRIDDAARALTEGRPAAGFASRVVARLDAPARRRPRAWLLAPAAAAAIVVLAIVMPREETSDVPLKPERTASEVTEARPTMQPTDAGLKARTTTAPAQAGLKARTTTAPAQAGLKARTTPVQVPVEFETDLAVAPIELAPMTVPSTVVRALEEPEPIAVEGLTIGAIETIDSGQ